MTLRSLRVCVAPGEGLVARLDSSVVVVSPSGAEHQPFIDRLLELCATPTEDQRSVVRRVGALVTGTPPELVPAFGILVETGDSVVALLAGDVALAITTGQGVETHEGRDASTYVERRLRRRLRQPVADCRRRLVRRPAEPTDERCRPWRGRPAPSRCDRPARRDGATRGGCCSRRSNTQEDAHPISNRMR